MSSSLVLPPASLPPPSNTPPAKPTKTQAKQTGNSRPAPHTTQHTTNTTQPDRRHEERIVHNASFIIEGDDIYVWQPRHPIHRRPEPVELRALCSPRPYNWNHRLSRLRHHFCASQKSEAAEREKAANPRTIVFDCNCKLLYDERYFTGIPPRRRELSMK